MKFGAPSFMPGDGGAVTPVAPDIPIDFSVNFLLRMKIENCRFASIIIDQRSTAHAWCTSV